MIKISSQNFTKKAASIVDALHNECISLIGQLGKFGIITTPGPEKGARLGAESSNPWAKQWKCLAEQAKETENAELLQKFKNTLIEALDYKQKNPGMKGVNFSQLSSASELLPLIQSLGSK
jgi:hypothetical protein